MMSTKIKCVVMNISDTFEAITRIELHEINTLADFSHSLKDGQTRPLPTALKMQKHIVDYFSKESFIIYL